VIYHLNDLEADFRAFYGLTPADIVELTGPHFLALAHRISAYPGVMQARYAAEHQDDEGTAGSRGTSKDDRFVEATPVALQTDPAFAGLISYGTG
jgi:hypothetical protein